MIPELSIELRAEDLRGGSVETGDERVQSQRSEVGGVIGDAPGGLSLFIGGFTPVGGSRRLAAAETDLRAFCQVYRSPSRRP